MAVAIAVLAGCTAAPAPSGEASPDESAPASPSISPEAELAAWIEFRHAYGLRTDVDWVLQVAEAPDAVEITVPLLPFEADQVKAVNRAAEDLAVSVRDYGNQFPEEFAGVVREGPIVVLLVSDRVDAHQAAVQATFGEGVGIRARQVAYSRLELTQFAEMTRRTRAWFGAIGAELVDVAVDEGSNQVVAAYRANVPVEPEIHEHFRYPVWLQLRDDGEIPWEGPLGDLEVRVVDRAGLPVPVECVLRTLDRRVPNEHEPAVAPDGKCAHEDVPAAEWLVDLTFGPEGARTTVTATVAVPADGLGESVVVVDPQVPGGS